MLIKEHENKPRPIIGVLVNKIFLHVPGGKLFAAKMMQANEKARCSIYFFSPENIDWDNKRIKGYLPAINNKKWLGDWRPFPDIIYDRGAGFRNDEKTRVEEVRRHFHDLPNIQFINSGKLGKWESYAKLSRFNEVKNCLPETRLYRDFQDIREMMARHRTIFLKTSEGSGGRGVFSIEKQDQGFYLRYYHNGTHRARFAATLRALRPYLDRIARAAGDRIVVQQGVHLVKFRGRRLDLRVLMVKGKDGIWKAVYNQARVAQKGAVITNLSLGGDVMNYSDIYPALKASYPGIPSDGEIRAICAGLARYIEKGLGPFGEIGMDLGIDEDGKTWLLEANSKPSKLPEKYIEDNVGISPQFLATLEYARFLFSQKQDGI
jgi:hypothetical protein